MSEPLSAWTRFRAIAMVGFGLALLPAPVAVASGEPAASVPGTGVIVGRVRYQSDSRRPWRLGRYYIKSARTGALAEAVVALAPPAGAGKLKAPDGPRAPATLTVDQKDFQFVPETVAIRAEDRVRFLNHDPQIHNVQTFHTRQSFNITMAPGAEHDEVFPAASGLARPYRIGCAFHGGMRAWIFVFDHPWFQVTGKEGTFRLADVPPGQYRLEVAHPAGDLRGERAITVKAGGEVEVEVVLSPDDLVHPPAKVPAGAGSTGPSAPETMP